MMKKITLRFLLALACFFLPLRAFALETPVILPPDDPGTDPSHRVVWSTDPGIRYELQKSTDLEEWTTIDGFPSKALALAEQHEFETDLPALFFRVIELDEQPPEIVSRFPDDEDFAIGRFSTVSVALADRSGIDPGSIILTIGSHGSFTLADPEVTLVDDVLVYDTGGDSALGAYGDTVTVNLDVADIHGWNTAFEWSFDLEVETAYAESLFIFGSPDAVRSGQLIGPIPTRIVAQRWARNSGPVRMNADADPWALESVESDRVIVEYSGETPPEFFIDQYITNLTPATVEEIFNRKITDVVHDDQARTVTLLTEDVPLWEIMPHASLRLSGDALAFEVGEDGTIIRAVALKAVEFDSSVSLPPVEIDWSGKAVMGTYTDADNQSRFQFGLPIEKNAPSGFPWDSRLFLDSAKLTITPTMGLAADLNILQTLNPFGDGIKHFRADTALEVEASLVPRYEFYSQSIGLDYEKTLWTTTYRVWVPYTVAWLAFSPKLDLKAGFDAALTGSVQAGASGGFTPAVVVDYKPDRDPEMTFGPRIEGYEFDLVPPEVRIDGSAGVYAQLLPQLDVLIIDLVGFYVRLDPKLEARGTAALVNETPLSAEYSVNFNAFLNAGMLTIGLGAADWLPQLDPPYSLFEWERKWIYPPADEDPEVAPDLAILLHPRSRSVRVGDPIDLEVQTNLPSGVTYEWFKNGSLYQYGGNQLTIFSAVTKDSGDYRVRVSAGGQSVTSDTATVTVTAPPGPVPEGMVLVEGGTLSTSNGLDGTAVSTFHIGRYEVTWWEWQEVRAWAAANGYDIGSVGAGCANDHPVHSVSWFDVLKWCNARSEMEGLTPVYIYNGSTYRSGEPTHTSISQNLSANGYRLPQEAEWEFAARGGNRSNGYTYAGSNDLTAVGWNWGNSSGSACNLSSSHGTWPVGQKAANELGLYDMSGNVWEWCWDQSGSYRRFRGGSWRNLADSCTVSYRISNNPDGRISNLGFRIARSSGN